MYLINQKVNDVSVISKIPLKQTNKQTKVKNDEKKKNKDVYYFHF